MSSAFNTDAKSEDDSDFLTGSDSSILSNDFSGKSSQSNFDLKKNSSFSSSVTIKKLPYMKKSTKKTVFMGGLDKTKPTALA